MSASIENEFFEITLMEDYLNNWLQIKSIDLTNDLTLKCESIFVYSVYNVQFIVRFTWGTFCINYFH